MRSVSCHVESELKLVAGVLGSVSFRLVLFFIQTVAVKQGRSCDVPDVAKETSDGPGDCEDDLGLL